MCVTLFGPPKTSASIGDTLFSRSFAAIYPHNNDPVFSPSADTGEQELWCEECNGGQGYCDYPENVYCGARPICDEFDENCELQPTEAPSQCDAIPCGSGLTYEPLGPCEVRRENATKSHSWSAIGEDLKWFFLTTASHQAHLLKTVKLLPSF